MLTKKEFRFWLLSTLTWAISIPFLLFAPYRLQGWGFLFYFIGMIFMLFIRNKNAPAKPVPTRIWQKRWFWAVIFIPVIVLLVGFYLIFKPGQSSLFVLSFLPVEFSVLNYFQTKYDWRTRNQRNHELLAEEEVREYVENAKDSFPDKKSY